MNIETHEQDGVTILSIAGRMDSNSSPAIDQNIAELMGKGTKKLLLDLHAMQYVSSAGVRVVLTTAKKLKASGGTLRLCGLNDTVRQIFDLAGLSSMLPIFASREEGLRDF